MKILPTIGPETIKVNNLKYLLSETDIVNYVGNKSINYYGCYTCHDIEGYENAKPIDKSFFFFCSLSKYLS